MYFEGPTSDALQTENKDLETCKSFISLSLVPLLRALLTLVHMHSYTRIQLAKIEHIEYVLNLVDLNLYFIIYFVDIKMLNCSWRLLKLRFSSPLLSP